MGDGTSLLSDYAYVLYTHLAPLSSEDVLSLIGVWNQTLVCLLPAQKLLICLVAEKDSKLWKTL